MNMKKYGLVFLCAGLLLLSGCQKTSPEDTPEPTPEPTPAQSQMAGVPPVTPEPTRSAHPSTEAPVFPAFLEEFDFPKVEALMFGAGEMTFLKAWLTEEELDQLKESLAMDTWWEATDLPEMGIDSDYCLYSGEEDVTTTRSFLVTGWDEEKCLILAKDWNGDHHESYTYYAPVPVLETFEQYISDKNLFPDFVRSFEMDQINVDLPASGTGESGHQVYLLDETQRYSLINALDPDTWTVVRYQGGDLTLTQAPALELLDSLGNRVLLADGGEENCLILCIYSDSYRRYTDHGTEAVVCYQAPAAALKNAQKLVEQLKPLGTIDQTAARYHDLFWADPGFDALLNLADGSGRLSDDQLMAYALIREAYDSYYDSEVGIPTAQIDRITRQYFGRVVGSYDTSMSKTLPSGNVTATGWDIGGSRHLVLSGEPEEDEYGSISADFLVYSLGEDAWIDGTMDRVLLDHMREYVLTGNVSEYPDPIKVSVTFRIETEEADGVQREYVVYDAVRIEGDRQYGVGP